MSLETTTYRVAPPGFTAESWAQFEDLGYLVFEDAIPPDQVAALSEAIDRLAAADPRHDPAKHFSRQNIVEHDPAFAALIDHPRHIGFAYDLYGELTKLHLSNCMLRPRGGWHNLWHPDGARALPYQVFAPRLPLQTKVSYWLTDVPEPRMGNLVVMPGSHRDQYFDSYDTHESVPGEYIFCPKAGTMTIMNASLWHRVEPNESDVVRKNVFLTYSPAWLVSEDRHTNDSEWLETLTREQRILMRSYSHPYNNQKPPPEDTPLFLDRETGLDHDAGKYRAHVSINRRKRLTWHEKHGG